MNLFVIVFVLIVLIIGVVTLNNVDKSPEKCFSELLEKKLKQNKRNERKRNN